MTIDEALLHAGNLRTFPQDIVDRVADSMPGYLWIVDNWSGDTGLEEYDVPMKTCRLIRCGRCDCYDIEEKRGGRYRVSYPQNDIARCPFCWSEVTVKHVSRGIRHLYNRLDVVFYRRSAVDPDVVVAIAAHCMRPYGLADPREPWELEPIIDPRGIAVFDVKRRDDIRLQSRQVWQDRCDGFAEHIGYMWKRVKSMKAMSFGDDVLFMSQRPGRVLLKDTLEAAIEGTPIARAWCEAYLCGTDGVEALDMITRHPCVEYMTKLGLDDFVVRGMNKSLPPRLINWKGANMPRVLRLSRERLGQLKGKGIRLTPNLCAVLQYVDKKGIRCGIETADGVVTACRNEAANVKKALDEALEPFPPERRPKALKYIARNHDLTIRDITDLWAMLLAAGGTLNDADAFPKDFKIAHDRLIDRMESAKNAKKDIRIAARAKVLAKKFGFNFGGLILRPAETAAEVVREGQVLHHCVGTYVNKYADGETAIFVLRRAVEPDAPWRTVEISPMTGKVLQDRGLHNDWGGYAIDDNYRAMLKMFWEAWGERKERRDTA